MQVIEEERSLAALNDPWSCTSESIRVKNGVKKRVRWLIPLHIMMVELVGGVDAKFKWDISAKLKSWCLLSLIAISRMEKKHALGKQPTISNFRCPNGRGDSDDDPR